MFGLEHQLSRVDLCLQSDRTWKSGAIPCTKVVKAFSRLQKIHLPLPCVTFGAYENHLSVTLWYLYTSMPRCVRMRPSSKQGHTWVQQIG